MGRFGDRWKARGGADPASRPALLHGTDLVLSLVILAICGALYAVTTTFDQVSVLLSQNIPPEWFPRLLIWVIVVLSLGLPFEHLFHRGGRATLDEERSTRIAPMAGITAVLLLAVVAAIPLIGMVAAIVLVCALLPVVWGERRRRVILAFAVLFPAAVFLLFSGVLEIYFEPGRFGPAL